jgi:hypothetical protein
MTCVICQDDLSVGTDYLHVLPCKHVYHLPCILISLTSLESRCPLCRRDVHDQYIGRVRIPELVQRVADHYADDMMTIPVANSDVDMGYDSQ